jgi:MFS family permease
MDRNTRNAAIAAALILLGFGVVGYYMPVIMRSLGAVSPYAGAAAAGLFVLAFFGIFWLRGRRQRRGDE